MKHLFYWQDTNLGAELRWGVSSPKGGLRSSLRIAEIIRDNSKVNRPVEYKVKMATQFTTVRTERLPPFLSMDKAKKLVQERTLSLFYQLGAKLEASEYDETPQ